MSDLLENCPRWGIPCMKEKCISYEVHTKQRFKNLKSGKYIPLDQIYFYSNLPEEQLEETIERSVTTVKECKFYGKILQIEETTDHRVPTEE